MRVLRGGAIIAAGPSRSLDAALTGPQLPRLLWMTGADPVSTITPRRQAVRIPVVIFPIGEVSGRPGT
ncbi:hypothetical protein [Streptomyces sp. NPDC097619]|uniref:hypothetical protein n=1 Tax=Streptomyces sp. NPDC097619 TaxID=3157228 RepID=UPI0033249918